MTTAPRKGVRRLVCSVAAFVVPLGVSAQERLVWEDEFDKSGRTDIAFDVAVSGNTTVVVGAASTSTGVDTVVRGYDQSAGTVRWTDQVPAFPDVIMPMFLASVGNRVFAASYTLSPTCSSCSDIFVRAYDASTGQVLWDDLFDKGRDDFPQAIAASSTVVAVVGYGGNTAAPPITAIDFIVRAYEPATGIILWEDQVDNGADVDDAAWAVAIEGNRLFVAGTTATAAGRDLLLRAYEATTGTLIWELRRPSVFPAALTAHAGLVFVAGAAAEFTSAFLGAYHARNGNLRWEDTSGTELFLDLKIQGQRLVAVGFAGSGSIVRVYTAQSGVVNWDDITTPSPGFFDFHFAVDVTSKAVYVTGSVGEDFGTGEFLVRGYDLATGELLLDDRSHPNASVAGLGIVASKKRVFAVGFTANGSGDDFLIRAYNVKDIETPGLRTD